MPVFDEPMEMAARPEDRVYDPRDCTPLADAESAARRYRHEARSHRAEAAQHIRCAEEAEARADAHQSLANFLRDHQWSDDPMTIHRPAIIPTEGGS